MKEKRISVRCYCGNILPIGAPGTERLELEVACSCGRRLAFESLDSRWVYRGSVIRAACTSTARVGSILDSERYSFEVTDPGPRRVSVEIVFSRSQRIAEVGVSNGKPVLFAGIRTPTQARRKWLELRRRELLRGESRVVDSPAEADA